MHKSLEVVVTNTVAAPVRSADRILRARLLHARMRRLAFILLVVAPTLLSVLFYGFIAVPRYVSETRIVVRSASTARMNGLDMLFRTMGLSKAVDDAYVVRDYLLSRDVLRDLATAGVSARDIFMHSAADRLSQHPRPWREDSQESLYDHFLERVKVSEDEAKGILTVSVITFTPDDSHKLAQAMVELAENMVNRMNRRAQLDATLHSQQELRLAREEVEGAQIALTTFRNTESLLDPSRSSESVLETISQLSADLAYASAELAQVQKNSPRSPALPSIRNRIAALSARIGIERGTMAGPASSLVTKVATYDQLNLRRTIAEQRLTSAIGSLEAARQEAIRQHIYIEQVVKAALPDAPTEPRRIRSIMTAFVVGFILFGVYWILSIAAEEHAQ